VTMDAPFQRVGWISPQPVGSIVKRNPPILYSGAIRYAIAPYELDPASQHLDEEHLCQS
jgi:hypothetical protein